MRHFLIFTCIAGAALAQQPAAIVAPKEISPGIFEGGGVRIDKAAGTVSFPAKINMVDGLVEYILVTPQGSTHESVLVTEVQPQQVHMAMLLLGAKGMAQPGSKAPEHIDAEYLAKAPKLTGDRIFLTAKWTDKEGRAHTAPVERWIMRRKFAKNKKPVDLRAEDGPWLYTGSYFFENNFLAQSQGVFASVVTFPSALINNPRTGANDDQMWFVDPAGVPPKGTAVEFSIKLEPAKPAGEKPKDKTK